MCTILTFVDGDVVESCGELRAKGYTVPHEWAHSSLDEYDLAADDTCLCNVALDAILAQQPERVWLEDPFGRTEDGPDVKRWWL